MKRKPNIPCPFCGRLWHHIADAFLCADLDIKEQAGRDRRLTRIDPESKGNIITTNITKP